MVIVLNKIRDVENELTYGRHDLCVLNGRYDQCVLICGRDDECVMT